jgi:glyoxylate reductase
MAKSRIFVTRRIPKDKLARLQEVCDVDLWDSELPPGRNELLQHVGNKKAILSLLTDTIDGQVMDIAGPDLKVISNCAVGVDNIDLQEATRRGIPVGHTPGVLTDTTADFAFALLLAAGRRIVEADHFTRAGKWKTWGLTQLLGQDLSGATLGIIGFGRIGRGVAKRALGFEMRVLFYDPSAAEDEFARQVNARQVDLDTLLREADFISIHTPLNEDTYHLIDRQAFAKMKPTAVLVNTARGPVVDPGALYEALKSRTIRFAALDVTEPEPIPQNNPLLQLDNLIITPHIASASVETRGKMVGIAVENLLAGLEGVQLPYCANPDVY